MQKSGTAKAINSIKKLQKNSYASFQLLTDNYSRLIRRVSEKFLISSDIGQK